MKAWRLFALGDHRLVEAPVPAVGEGSVLIRVRVVQPSVTDAEVIKGDAFSSRTLQRLAASGFLQLGHEYCGQVVEVGKGVVSLKVGDRVSSATGNVHCGRCAMCLSGKYAECLSPHHIGGDIPGAFAEYMCLPELGAVRMPDGPTDNEVAAFQPLCACLASVRSAGIRMGDSVLVLGQGAVGLGVLQAAKLAGAGLLIAVARRPESLALSRKYGADITINATETDVVREVLAATGGHGVDVAFEAAGGSPAHGLSGFATLLQALQSVRPEGTVVQAAILVGTLELNTDLLKARRVRYIQPEANTSEFLSIAAQMGGERQDSGGPADNSRSPRPGEASRSHGDHGEQGKISHHELGASRSLESGVVPAQPQARPKPTERELR
ncbi:MAG: alcohol dehydrogenase catalytic domain-containing protein [Chloroflexi bacterium]|nr:alcohol dehydrogenase catalytic domain-containing protein [Chloroflexota bacterium]